MAKVAIRPDMTHTEIIHLAATSDIGLPETVAHLIESVFGTPIDDMSPVETPGGITSKDQLKLVAEQLGGPGALLELPEPPEMYLSVPELPIEPEAKADREQWLRYNYKEFSPYVHAGEGNPRSVAVVTVRGGAFCRIDERRILVPCDVHAAIGCDGKFTAFSSPRPLQISQKDLRKWTYQDGDTLVVIGGRSREARIIPVSGGEAAGVATILGETEGEDNRAGAVVYLQERGYDVGTEGRASKRSPRMPTIPVSKYDRVLPADNPQSPAGRLQQKAERDGITSLSRIGKEQVAMRLLGKYGWEPTWNWFKDQFGTKHNPEILYENLEKASRNMTWGRPDIPPKSWIYDQSGANRA